jgi:drug/metabolite transporter (DMT)-like permease
MSKSCKLIVVMLGGVLLLGKKYHFRDYAAAAAIVAGLFIFQHDAAKAGSSSVFGIGILLVSLLFDSLNSNYNEKVVSVNKCRPSLLLLPRATHPLADATCYECSRTLTSSPAS